MARPRQQTTIQLPPRVKSFTPSGYYAGEVGNITLNIEEYEAIRLLDYEGLSQAEAAEYMDVSRPTLTRIYERARNKMAAALVGAKQLTIEGGSSQYNGCWGRCNKCQSRFCAGGRNIEDACPLCSSTEIETADLSEMTLQTPKEPMIAAIPVESDRSDAVLYTKFARSPFFALTDSANGNSRIVANPFFGNTQGAGAAVVAFLVDEHGVNMFIAYELGLKVQALAHKRKLAQIILHSEHHNLASIYTMIKKK